ncbi:MAG: ATP-dependent DNA helicase RecG [Mycoplasmatota bacterium]
MNEIIGSGKKTDEILNKLNIYNQENLIEYYPYRYDVLKRSNLNEVLENDIITIDGILESKPSVYYIKSKLDKMSFRINEGNNIFSIIIYNRGFLKNQLDIGNWVTIIGKLDRKRNVIVATDIIMGKLPDQPVILPVYHLTQGITSKQINTLIRKNMLEIPDVIPDFLIEKYGFPMKKQAVFDIHFSNEQNSIRDSINYLKYEELFIYMLKMHMIAKTREIGLNKVLNYKKVNKFIDSLAFKLTEDQLKSVNDIYLDSISSNRMNRLVQGDVGSGKTIVSIIALYMNYLSGYQGTMMAPTEILARQHFENLLELFKNYNINIRLLTGKLKVSEKKKIYKELLNNEIDILVGTHAVISEAVIYYNLGLVITDEQHRFGVVQRSNLKNKGITPDVLYMSATPIPRTYALTIYGDMDVSNIKTMPNGRKEIITYLKKDDEIKDVLSDMLIQLKKNNQIYVVSPLVLESEKIDLENATQLYEKMNRAFGKFYKVGLLHGKMKSNEKEEIMQKFKTNEIQILVSTTVIEVGVDVKNATMMVIFDANRFGLSTIHQLRGRVGRNDLQSYCVLISKKDTKRLNIMTKTNDGFKVSEADFKLRGSGNLFGFKQSGDMNFKLADLKRDYDLLVDVSVDSKCFLEKFDINNYLLLKKKLEKNVNID